MGAVYIPSIVAPSSALVPSAMLSSQLQIPVIIAHTEDPTATIKAALRRGYTFIWISELWAAMQGKRQLPQKPALLTFDDGRLELFTVIFPVISSFGVKGNAFIISDFTDGNPDGMVDSTVSPALPGATWANLRTMHATGLWEWHNHTRIHAGLLNQTSPTRISDLNVCSAAISSQLQVPKPLAIAYPNGAYDVPSIIDCKSVGLVMGFDYWHGGKSLVSRLSRLGDPRWTLNRADLADVTGFHYARDEQLHHWENDITGGRNASNVLAYWTLSAGGTIITNGEDVHIDNRVVASAQVITTADKFKVQPYDSLYYHFFGQSELHTAGNSGIRIAQYDSAQSLISNIDLKAFTTTTAATLYEGETVLASTCQYVAIQVWCDAAYTGLVHYKDGYVRIAP